MQSSVGIFVFISAQNRHAILACVESCATLGEICDTLRKEFGEYRGAGMF
jgi:hypothetical protein